MLWHLNKYKSGVFDASELQEYALEGLRRIKKSFDQTYNSRHPWSPYFGQAGPALVGALLADTVAHMHPTSLEDKEKYIKIRNGYIDRFVSFSSLAVSSVCTEDEVLYGRAGFLIGSSILNSNIEDVKVSQEVISRVAGSIMSGHLRHHEDTQKLLFSWEWHGTQYLGAAHGSMGILFALLSIPQSVLSTTNRCEECIQETLNHILTLECDEEGAPSLEGEFPTRVLPQRTKEPLVQWCHGAPGAIFLFSRAFEVFGDTKYLDAAIRAGEAVWHRGLLRKGPGLCHGISGNAYSLLVLYGLTNDQKWWFRARQFASFMGSESFLLQSRVPDHPYSLFEGWAAFVCLANDVTITSGALAEMSESRKDGFFSFPMFSSP